MIEIIPFQTGEKTPSQALLEKIEQGVQEAFHQDCQIKPGLPIPEKAYHPERSQYAAEALLDALPTSEESRFLGVGDLDMYTKGLDYVFGLADSMTNRAVIALARLRNSFYSEPENEALFTERAIKEAIHELGHTYGLGHCSDPHCVMNFSNTLEEMDYKTREFCAQCQENIPSFT